MGIKIPLVSKTLGFPSRGGHFLSYMKKEEICICPAANHGAVAGPFEKRDGD